MNITFVYDGYASLNGTPDHLVPRLNPQNLCNAPHGLSGTEVNMFGLADELARRGYDVRIFSNWTTSPAKVWKMVAMGSVTFLDLKDERSIREKTDVVVAYHDGRPLDMWPDTVLKMAHHQSYGLSPQEDARNFANVYITPTERVSNYHRKRRGWDVHTIHNAWDYGDFQEWKPVPGRLVYTTSYERGFHRLMEAFPLIKERVPSAHVVAFTRGGPDAHAKMTSSNGLVDLAILPVSSRNDVLKMIATASCFAYPCDVPSPCEVWPMSVTDCLATGVPVVLAPDDGIEDVFQGGAILTQPVKRSDWWLGEFIEYTLQVLKNLDDEQSVWSERGKRWAKPHTFFNSCDLFLKVLERYT